MMLIHLMAYLLVIVDGTSVLVRIFEVDRQTDGRTARNREGGTERERGRGRGRGREEEKRRRRKGGGGGAARKGDMPSRPATPTRASQ